MGTNQPAIGKEALACRPYCFPEITRMRQAADSEKAGRFTRSSAEGAVLGKGAQRAADDTPQAEKRAFEAGYQQGHGAASAAVGKELFSLMASLRQALDETNRRQEKLYRQVEGESVRLALAVARKIVMQELQTDPGIVVHVMREALAAMADTRRLTVRMHPEDAARMRLLGDNDKQLLSEGDESMRIEADDSVSKGGCRILSGSAELDATVEGRLQVIMSAFKELLPATKYAARGPEEDDES